MDYVNVVANSCQSNATEKARLTKTPKTLTQDTPTIPPETPTNVNKNQSPKQQPTRVQPSKQKERSQQHSASTTNEANHDSAQIPHNEEYVQPYGPFIAAKRRRRNIPYFLSNIDTGVVEKDVYDMLKSKNVFVSNIRIFHGRNGSSARVNISSDDVPKVEIEYFWPDGICRKWVPQHEYTRDTAARKIRPF